MPAARSRAVRAAGMYSDNRFRRIRERWAKPVRRFALVVLDLRQEREAHVK